MDPVDGMIGDAGEDLPQVRFRIAAVQFGRADEAVDGGGAAPTRIGSDEEVNITT